MRITADVILRAQVSINPLRERELNLRGLKAPAIENLGVTKDGFDCIDLSDNEIKKLENFPRLRRLRMLLLHNNHIAKFADALVDSIGNLEYLILTGNRIAQLAELDRLVCLSKLDTLALTGNPVTKRKYYREYVIHRLPQLKVLDYKKIKPHDREAANVLFNSLAGHKIVRDAAETDTSDASVAHSTHGIEHVTIAPPPPAPAAPKPAAPKPAAPAPAPVPAPKLPAPTPAAPAAASPVKTKAPAKTPSPVNKTQAAPKAEATTPPRTPTKAKAQQQQQQHDSDVAMADAADDDSAAAPPASTPTPMDVTVEKEEPAAPVVPLTPSKPIEQMTVAILRDELKRRDLSIKGLKAELVKRLKDATGA